MSHLTKALTIISAVFVLLFGIWKLEHSGKFRFSIEATESAKTEKKAQMLALKKRRIYETNPNLDFDLPRVSAGHSSAGSGVGSTFGQRNIVNHDGR